jgi:phosphatidylserine/phosphatidylglycerophosphate/cardiolipin synthase-like enzyme
MSIIPNFIMTIVKATALPAQSGGEMSIIIQRPYAFLEKELKNAFKGQEDVKVIVNGRYGERRATTRSITQERRKTDRRRSKEELVEVLLSA